jgi:hypothetical protein
MTRLQATDQFPDVAGPIVQRTDGILEVVNPFDLVIRLSRAVDPPPPQRPGHHLVPGNLILIVHGLASDPFAGK